MTGSPFGPMTGRLALEQGILNLLQQRPAPKRAPLIRYYVAEAERQAGLVKRTVPQPETFRGGVDFAMWRADMCPLIIASVRSMGELTRPEPGMYGQWFEVQLSAIVMSDDEVPEDTARMHADIYQIALAKLIDDNGSIGPNPYDPSLSLGQGTLIDDLPTPEFAVDADTSRNIMRATVVFRTLVQPVMRRGGPWVFPLDPYTEPADWPAVETTAVTLVAQSLT